MRIGGMLRRNSDTWLTHVFGRGLDDERYVVEKYVSLPSGEIRPVEAEEPGTGARRGKRRTIMSAGAVKKMRPQRDEIIVCTALNLKASGIQYWGETAVGILTASSAR